MASCFEGPSPPKTIAPLAVLTDVLRVLRWRGADERLEVLDEVRLVEIPEVQRHLHPIYSLAVRQPVGRLLEPVATDYPLRADADVPAEEPLQRPLVQAQPARCLVDPGDLPVGNDEVDYPADDLDVGVQFRQSLAEEDFSKLDHLPFVLQ